MPRDPVRAARSFVRGCELGLPVACTNVANLASDRPVRSYEPSVEEFSGLLDPSPEGAAERARAADEFPSGCDAGDARACYHLAFALATGRGVPQDKARAVELLLEACRLGLPGVCPPSGGLEQ